MLKKYTKLAYLLGLMVTIAAGAAVAIAGTSAAGTVAVFGDQGKNGKGGGRGHGGQGKGNRGGGNGEGRGHGGGEFRGQGRGNREVRQQQRVFDRQPAVIQQQRWSDWNSRRQQQWSDQQSRRQQRDSVREIRRQQRDIEKQARHQQRGNNRTWQGPPQWTNWNWGAIQRNNDRSERRRGRDNDDRRFRRDDRRVVYVSPQRNYWNNIWNRASVFRDNRRFTREQSEFFREQRRAQRLYEQGQYYNNGYYVRRSEPVYYNVPVYYDNSYNGNYYGYNDGSSIKDQILRTLISSVLGGGGFDIGALVPGAGYDQQSDNNGYSYYTPTYVYDRPNYGPAPADYYYDQPYYSQGGLGGIGGSILGALPIAEIVQQYTGDNPFVSQIVGSFLTQGYDQGYLAGQTAREYGYPDAAYDDPYAYRNGSCDLYSASLGENRRYLSEGYDLGYRDALAGNTNYDPISEGNTDLVGALLNNVLSGI